jgi:hypothetical protein
MRHPGHLPTSSSLSQKNLLPNHCVVIHDYSENYGCKEKFELQQTYFQRTEVSIHVSVIYRHAILEVDGVESLPDILYMGIRL